MEGKFSRYEFRVFTTQPPPDIDTPFKDLYKQYQDDPNKKFERTDVYFVNQEKPSSAGVKLRGENLLEIKVALKSLKWNCHCFEKLFDLSEEETREKAGFWFKDPSTMQVLTEKLVFRKWENDISTEMQVLSVSTSLKEPARIFYSFCIEGKSLPDILETTKKSFCLGDVEEADLPNKLISVWGGDQNVYCVDGFPEFCNKFALETVAKHNSPGL